MALLQAGLEHLKGHLLGAARRDRRMQVADVDNFHHKFPRKSWPVYDLPAGLRDHGKVFVEIFAVLGGEEIAICRRGPAIFLAARPGALAFQMHEPDIRMHAHRADRCVPSQRKIRVFIVAINIAGGKTVELFKAGFVKTPSRRR